MKTNYASRVSLSAACILLFVGIISAQTFTQVTADVRIVGGSNFIPNTTIYTSKDMGKSWGMSYFGLITDGWAEAYAGPYWKMSDHFTVGIAAGIETPAPHLRFGGSVTYFGEKSSILLFLEKGSGRDNYWYSFIATTQPKKVLYGMRATRFYGIGPTIGIPIKSTTLTLAPLLYDLEAKKTKPTIFFAWTLSS